MNLEIINRFLKKTVVQTAVLLLLIYILLPNYLSSSAYLCEGDKITVGSCLDPSWHLSINWAIQKNFIFGKDYVFTYGALGFLGTRNALGFNPRYFVIFDLFIISNLAYILFFAIRRYCNLQTFVLCFLIAYTVASGSMYVDQIVFILLLISIFWLSYSLKLSRVWSLTIPVIITCLLFYIKVNISFVSLAIFYSYLIYFFIVDKRNYTAKALFGISVPCLIFLLSFPLNTDLIGYIRGGLSLIDGYNDAMSLKLNEYFNFLIYAFVMFVGFFIFFLSKNIKNNLILLLTGLIFSFVLYKQGFVRSDLHITVFFAIFPGLCGILLIFYERISRLQILVVMGICVLGLGAGLYLGMYPSVKDRINYLNDIKSPPDLSERYEKSFSRFDIPAEVLHTIGEKTVDIIPWNIDYIYFNSLNYDPRPVVQSYSAYTPYLINLNKQKYESDSAPEFVIFSNQSIDGRYGFFDDQEAKLDLIKNYTCIGFFDSENKFLLFQRKPGNAVINISPAIEQSIKFAEEYPLADSTKSYFIKIKVNYTLLGKAIRVLYKPFQIVINFTLEDGSTRRCKAIVSVLESGVLVNPIIEEEKDFFNFVQGIPVPETKKIKSFRIELDSLAVAQRATARASYSKDIELSISEVSIVKNN